MITGQGSYSGKGQKGQKPEAVENRLARKALRNLMMSAPKLRGFKSFTLRQCVQFGSFGKHFNDGDIVNLGALKEKGLVGVRADKIKILGDGELTKN